jgi:hypothetical protein
MKDADFAKSRDFRFKFWSENIIAKQQVDLPGGEEYLIRLIKLVI